MAYATLRDVLRAYAPNFARGRTTKPCATSSSRRRQLAYRRFGEASPDNAEVAAGVARTLDRFGHGDMAFMAELAP